MEQKVSRRRKAPDVVNDNEFVPALDTDDDLETFNEEAAYADRDEQKMELKELEAESELPLDQLLLRYGIGSHRDITPKADSETADVVALGHTPLSAKTVSLLELRTGEMQEHVLSAASHLADEDGIILRYQSLESKIKPTKPLPHFPEPIPNKCHWQHVVEEMTWLSGDFSRERKWRRRTASKIATLLVAHHSRNAQTKRGQVKDITSTRRAAKAISNMIISFWNKVEKVLTLQRQVVAAHTEKLQLDAQLDDLVKVTESYSSQLAERLSHSTSFKPQNLIGEHSVRDSQYNDTSTVSSAKKTMVADGNTSGEALRFPLLKYTLRDYQLDGVKWLTHSYISGLNVLLADEMGLGKTIQTIALLSTLASEFGNWGPHLIVVPTSVMLNWEVEFKKWCPALKVFTYFGSVKERRLKRHGWTKPNSFHVCITSYKIVTQDQVIFRRKNWEYLILDEAHMIKNWQSQRWQVLLNFSTKHRLLITGTPLQNELMELWALMHFLMPELFTSHSEFKDWFANPMSAMADGTQVVNETIVTRLHSILRPFILRRLKSDVEKSLPEKREHIVKCVLSRRQRRLYEEYISSSSTMRTLSSGNVMGMMNCLVQLRKVCNHPDLFAGRQICSAYDMTHVDKLSPFAYFAHLSHSAPRISGVHLEKTASEGRDECDRAECVLQDMRSYGMTDEVPCMKEPCAKQILSSLSRLRMKFQVRRNASRHCTQVDVIRNDDSMVRSTKCLHANDKETSYSRECRVALHSHLHDGSLPFTFLIPRVRTTSPTVFWETSRDLHPRASRYMDENILRLLAPLRKSIIRQSMFFPDKQLVQFDCGKLQVLATLLRTLKQGNHKVLIFTQMTRMLDILESFLNLHGYSYCRLDGSTSTEQRQLLTQRFNGDDRIFIFILSTRSGGFGINLTGADTVIFYDSDWNPAMDQQAQDRCHRIGQTRDVHIYRLIGEGTIEESILQKAIQKRELDSMAIQLGNFNTGTLVSTDVKVCMFGKGQTSHEVSAEGISASNPQADQEFRTRDETSYREEIQPVASFDASKLLPVERYALDHCATRG